MTLTPITETAQALSLDARRALLAYRDEVGALEPMGMTLTVWRELSRVRAIDLDDRLLPFGYMLRAAVLELELDKMDPPAPDPRDELVAWAKAWKAGGYAITSTRDQSAYARMVAAIEALS